MLILTVLIIGCSKEKLQKENSMTKQNYGTQNARISNQMSNDDMEKEIMDFIEKVNDTIILPAINYIEAFEYVEASLNFQYVNYNYSKCANTTTFTGSIEFSVDENSNMSFDNIRLAYNAILNDWKSKYHSISVTEKTPIVFDITEVRSTCVDYTMIVGYGELDLNEYDEGFVPQALTPFTVAGTEFNSYLYFQFEALKQQMFPLGYRVYLPVVRGVQYLWPLNHPSGGSDVYPPNNNGLTDYLFFYSDHANSNFHTDIDQSEYYFYRGNLNPIMQNYISNNNDVNYAAFGDITSNFGSGNPPNYSKIWHSFSFYVGTSFYTSQALWTL